MPHGEPSKGWWRRIFGGKKEEEKEKPKPARRGRNGKKKEPSLWERMTRGLAIARTLPEKTKKKHNPGY